MFEHAIPIRAVDFATAGGGLRRIDWGELVARLDARRELHAAAKRARLRISRASFDPHAASRLFEQGKQAVNRDDLEGRKSVGAIPRLPPGASIPTERRND